MTPRLGRSRPPATPETIEALFAAKEIVIACGSGGVGKTTTAAAAAAMAALPARGQDPGRDRRPGQTAWPAHSAWRASAIRGEARPAGCLHVLRVAAPGRAVGGHAGHQTELGFSGAPPRPRPGDRRPHPGQPAVPEHLRRVRAEPRLHRHGTALRDPLRGHLRSDRGGHPADPQRHRLHRGAATDGRVLLIPAVADADRPVSQPDGEHGVAALLPGRRPGPWLAVPRGHRRVLHPVPDHVSRLRRAGPRR